MSSRAELATKQAPCEKQGNENYYSGNARIEQLFDSMIVLRESQPKSAKDLSYRLNSVYDAPGGPERFGYVNKDLAKSFKSVYDKTRGSEDFKIHAVKQFESEINSKTVEGNDRTVTMLLCSRFIIQSIKRCNNLRFHMSKAEAATKAPPTDKQAPPSDNTPKVEQRLDSNQLQVGGDMRSLRDSQPPKSADGLADQLNAVYNAPGGPERFDNINKDLAKSFKSVYDKTPGGEDAKVKAVKEFELKINDKTVDGKGILAQVNDGKLSVRHLEATKTGEVHPELPGVHIKDIGNKLTTDLAEKKLERPGAVAGRNDKADTKQFPSDVLFQKALTSSEDWAKAPWKGANESQQKLLDAIKDPKIAELAKSLPAGMLDAKAGNPKEVNDFLEKKGFGRLLQERPNEEAVAATMNIQKEWKAEKSTMESDGKKFASVDKDGKVYNVDGKPVIELFKDPKDGITVYAIPNKPGTTGEQAMEEAKKLIPKANESTLTDQGKIRAPMLDLNVTEDLNWLKGMKGGDLTISQAKMQTTLKMDENGFDAKQALAMSATRGFKVPEEPKYQLNSEFTFVIAKDGKPVFAIPVEKDSWKDPKRR